ncbi:peptidylprolyl isomerase [Rhodobacteraceae bacterium]|nr:peptidylprolyl isomerase [Paracoccaceae bacterium]
MANKLRTHGKNMVVWVLLGLLILGLVGFSATNFGGNIDSIGSVGDTKVSTNDYARALQREQQSMSRQTGQQLSFQQAQMMGLDRRVQGQLFAQAAFEEAADQLGVSIGDSALATQIQEAQAFHGADGAFNRETYRMALRNQGLTETEFEEKLRGELSRSVLQNAIITGTPAPGPELDAFASYLTQTRDLAYAEVEEADLQEPLAQPTDDELRAWHDAHEDRFMQPETRQITYAWLSPDMIADQVQLTDDMLQEAYQARMDEFVQPERRLVERLIYPSTDEAQAARARLDAGDATFADLAKDRGLTLQDTDMGDVTKSDLGPAGDAVFGLDGEGVVGPVDTSLGPALFRINGVLAGEERSFEDAKEELGDEAAHENARRLIGDRSSKIEDLLAGGATLENLADETDMELGTVDFGPETDQGIAGYEAFRAAAQKATAEDFPQLVELEDGGIFALRLDGITPASVIPFEDSRDAVEADWRAAKILELKQARADAAVAKMADTEQAATSGLSATGLLTQSRQNLSRGAYLDGIPQGVIARGFELAQGESAKVTAEGRVFVVMPTAINEADLKNPDVVQTHDQLREQLSQAVSGDLLDLYARAVQSEAGIQIDSSAVTAVQAQMR